jgi:hypothetical protein
MGAGQRLRSSKTLVIAGGAHPFSPQLSHVHYSWRCMTRQPQQRPQPFEAHIKPLTHSSSLTEQLPRGGRGKEGSATAEVAAQHLPLGNLRVLALSTAMDVLPRHGHF